MDLKQLELVRAICREGGFSNAARRLGMSQPTLSKSIARLEAGLGVRLFERTGGAASPTAYGLFLAERADDVLTSMESIARELHDWASGDSGKLRIGIGPATRVKPLPTILTVIRQAFPDLQLQIRQLAGPALAEAVVDGRFDIAFSYAGNASHFGELLRIQIFSDDIVAAARPDHPIFDVDAVTPAALLRYPIASLGVVASFREWLGILTPEQQRNVEAFICDDDELMRQQLIDTDYVAHGPAFLFADDIAAGRLRSRSIEWPERFECWMLTTRAHWRSPIIKTIADLARRAF